MDESVRRESVSHRMKARQEPSEQFESLFHAYWVPIYRLLVRMVVDPAEAEDLALETFFRLHKYSPTHAGFNIRGWLQRVAINLGLQSIRSFKRREQYELHAGKDALDTHAEDQPHKLFEEKDERRMVQRILAQMNQRQAEILIMRHSGMAYKDIASALDLAPTSIGPLLLRAEREFEKSYRALTQEAEHE